MLDANSPAPTVAIVGSGPSGCYTGQFLAKSMPRAEITVFESLPTPYGLIRYGVAADHQGTKGVIRQFDRLFTRGGVRFAGNVAGGRDLDFDLLVRSFDVVVLATGLPEDRPLGVPQHPRARVVGAGALLRTLNGYPVDLLGRDERGRHVQLGRHVAVVGLGNVAIDVLRLLVKPVEALVGTDIDDESFAQLRPSPPAAIEVLSRSGIGQAKFDLAMLRELVSVPDVQIEVTGVGAHDGEPAAVLLRACTNSAADSPGLSAQRSTLVRLHFGCVPEAIDHRNGQALVQARMTADGRMVELLADTVITAIGFTDDAPDDPTRPTQGWSGPNVYRVGWLARGAKGTIAENRRAAQQVAAAIVDDFAAGRLQAIRPGFRAVEPLLGDRVIGFEGWQRIDEIERQAAPPQRCRLKITNLDEMLVAANRKVNA
jgi:ferredoxin/flavodoxin---NADP+ reductase